MGKPRARTGGHGAVSEPEGSASRRPAGVLLPRCGLPPAAAQGEGWRTQHRVFLGAQARRLRSQEHPMLSSPTLPASASLPKQSPPEVQTAARNTTQILEHDRAEVPAPGCILTAWMTCS